MKTKAKRFYLTILLFVVLLCDICFIVRCMFFWAIYVFLCDIRKNTKQIKKKFFPLTLNGKTLNFPLWERQISMGGLKLPMWGRVSPAIFPVLAIFLFTGYGLVLLRRYRFGAKSTSAANVLISKWQSLSF